MESLSTPSIPPLEHPSPACEDNLTSSLVGVSPAMASTLCTTLPVDTAAAAPLEPFDFLGLPVELRRMVYELYILDDPDFAVSYKLKQDEEARDPDVSPRKQAAPRATTQIRKNMLPLEATSKDIQHEVETAQLHLCKIGRVSVHLNILDANIIDAEGLVEKLPVDCFHECTIAFQVNWKWWHIDEDGLTDLVERLTGSRRIEIKVLCPMWGPLFEEWLVARRPLIESLEVHSTARNLRVREERQTNEIVHGKLETLKLSVRRHSECYHIHRVKVVDAQTGLGSWQKALDGDGNVLEQEFREYEVVDCMSGNNRAARSRIFDEPLTDKRFLW